MVAGSPPPGPAASAESARKRWRPGRLPGALALSGKEEEDGEKEEDEAEEVEEDEEAEEEEDAEQEEAIERYLRRPLKKGIGTKTKMA